MTVLSKLPPSPVTGSDNVAVIDSFSTADIIRLYREQENVEVALYFDGRTEIYLLECRDTGYRFYYPFETAGGSEFYEALAAENEKRGIVYDRDFAEDHQMALALIRPTDRVLEIGCNIGTFLERVSKITPNVTGLDFNSVAIEKARERGVNALNESIEHHAETHPEAYDVICAFQVFEHLTHVGAVTASTIKSLKPGGKLIISVPNNEPFYQRFNKYDPMNMPPHHAGLWKIDSLREFARNFDLELSEYEYYGTRGVLVDAYLRAKLMTDVRSLPVRHSVLDKLKMFFAAFVTVPLSAYDFAFRGVRNHANLFVVFTKKISDPVN